jgi:hypothetical protein
MCINFTKIQHHTPFIEFVDNLEKWEDLEEANEQMRKKIRVGMLNVMERLSIIHEATSRPMPNLLHIQF